MIKKSIKQRYVPNFKVELMDSGFAYKFNARRSHLTFNSFKQFIH